VLALYALNCSTIEAEENFVHANDKLKLKIFQYPELNGEYEVDANGTITLADIGDIPVDGLTTKDVANLVSQRIIRAGLSTKPGTSVEIMQSRPVYVLGDVQKPGEYTFRPGVTVLQVVSLAGGWLRFNDPGLVRVERDMITVKGELRQIMRRRFRLVARRALLNAELAMTHDVQFPQALVQQAGKDSALSQLLDQERSLLRTRVEAVETELESLNKTRTLYEGEIEGVMRQMKANQAQYDSVGKELKSIKALEAKGLTTATRVMGLERMLEQIEMNQQGFQTLVLRARQAITQLNQRVFDLENNQRGKVMAELEQTRIDLDDLNIKWGTNRSLLVEAQITAPTLIAGSDNLSETRNLTIVRVVKGNEQTLEANENTVMLPGDVLRVQRSTVVDGLGAPDMEPRDAVDPADDTPIPSAGGLTRATMNR
jgi:protein involved in polysaccharide export with SLBB domain